MLDTASDLEATVSEIRFPAGPNTLHGTLFEPAGPPRAAVVLNGATAVPQRFYRHFARWLAEAQGLACLTFDYADMGASATGPLRKSSATMASWALVDQPAARAALRAALPGVPIWVVGHSLGGMLLPMQDGVEEIAQVITVASGYVHHRDHPWPFQALARLLWFGHAPVAARMLGYLPGRRLGLGEDIPGGAYWQWRQWCTTHHSGPHELDPAIPAPDWARSGAPVRLVAVADDKMVPAPAVWRLEAVYGPAYCRRAVLDPAAFGLAEIGHIAAFARDKAAVWPAILGNLATG